MSRLSAGNVTAFIGADRVESNASQGNPVALVSVILLGGNGVEDALYMHMNASYRSHTNDSGQAAGVTNKT